MGDCIFCKIAKKELPAKIEYEDEQLLVVHDIKPKAPLHLLVIPKRHIISVAHLQEEDREMVGGLIFLAKKMAQEKGVKGYKLFFNVGKEGGQEVDHLHLHLLGYGGLEKQA